MSISTNILCVLAAIYMSWIVRIQQNKESLWWKAFIPVLKCGRFPRFIHYYFFCWVRVCVGVMLCIQIVGVSAGCLLACTFCVHVCDFCMHVYVSALLCGWGSDVCFVRLGHSRQFSSPMPGTRALLLKLALNLETWLSAALGEWSRKPGQIVGVNPGITTGRNGWRQYAGCDGPLKHTVLLIICVLSTISVLWPYNCFIKGQSCELCSTVSH